jgi:hypothetical protein
VVTISKAVPRLRSPRSSSVFAIKARLHFGTAFRRRQAVAHKPEMLVETTHQRLSSKSFDTAPTNISTKTNQPDAPLDQALSRRTENSCDIRKDRQRSRQIRRLTRSDRCQSRPNLILPPDAQDWLTRHPSSAAKRRRNIAWRFNARTASQPFCLSSEGAQVERRFVTFCLVESRHRLPLFSDDFGNVRRILRPFRARIHALARPRG